MVTIADKTILVTGANRGIGQALVEEAPGSGAKRVYAGTRQPLAHRDPRVTPVTLNVTSAAHRARNRRGPSLRSTCYERHDDDVGGV